MRELDGRGAAALGGGAAAFRLFYGAVIRSPGLANAWWLAILLCALPGCGAALLWMLARRRNAPKPGKVACALWTAALLLDGGVMLRALTLSASYAALPKIPVPLLTAAGAAALAAVCACGPAAAGGMARLYGRIALALGAAIAAAQLPHMRPGWITPLLGPGILPVVGGAAQIGGLAVLSAIVPGAGGAEGDDTGASALWSALGGCLAAAVMAALCALMAPPMAGAPQTARFRLDSVLFNGRSPLVLQFPMALIWYGGMFLAAACDAALCARMAGVLLPRTGPGLRAALAAGAVFCLALWRGEAWQWLYYPLAVLPLAGMALGRKRL